MKGVLVEQNRTPSIVSHIETIRQVLVIKVFNCFLQRDDVPLPRNVHFDGSFFSASRSWVSFVDAEPLLFVKRMRTSVSKRYSSLVGECFLSGASRKTDWHSSR